MAYELVQVTLGRLAAPLTSPPLEDFVDALDPVNKRRHEWFERMPEAVAALRAHGQTPYACTFRETFRPGGAVSESGQADWMCRA